LLEKKVQHRKQSVIMC